MTTVTGKGRLPRAIRELQAAVGKVRPGFSAGAKVSHTTRGTLVEPDGVSDNLRVAPRRPVSTVPRWG